MASGTNYGSGYDVSRMLEDLITDHNYGDEFTYGKDSEPYSVVADLPVTLMDLHISSMSEMPFDPLCWDADGNWIG